MRRLVALLAVVLIAAGSTAAAQGKKKSTSTPKNSTLAISGNATTLANCVHGKFYNTHPVGFSVRGTRIIVDLEGDDEFDGVAMAVVTQMGADAPDDARISFQYSDDGDGLDPQLDFELEHDANVLLLVGSFDGDPGCYFLKVDSRFPGDN